MKKILLKILICGIILISLSACTKKTNKENDNSKLYVCLQSELKNHIASGNSAFTEIPLEDITGRYGKIEYYKGVKTTEDNMYIILKMKNPQEAETLSFFELYFSNKFPTYQRTIINNDIYIYVHTPSNDIDFKEIENRCIVNDNQEEGKFLPDETINKLNNTNKIIIKTGDTALGTIDKEEIIKEILDAVTSIKQYGENSLCDGHSFDLEMYNENDELIDNIYLWFDGNRLIPQSIHTGCAYYISTRDDIDIRKIIEQETDFIFYGLSDFGNVYNEEAELIFEDEEYKYYLNNQKSDKVIINFYLNNLNMTLKYALNNNYITPKQLEIYDELLIKVKK